MPERNIKHAKQNLQALGKLVTQNTPGPKNIWDGFLQTHVYSPAFPFLILIGLLLLFGEPVVAWMTTPDNCVRIHGGLVCKQIKKIVVQEE